MTIATQPAFQPANEKLGAAQPALESVNGKIDWAPTAKVGVGPLAGAITVLINALVWQSVAGHEMSGTVASAFTTLLTFGVQYFVPERK